MGDDDSNISIDPTSIAALQSNDQRPKVSIKEESKIEESGIQQQSMQKETDKF